MAKYWSIAMVILALAVLHRSTSARKEPTDNTGGLKEQKNFIGYGGIGGYTGIGDNGLPFGGGGGVLGGGGNFGVGGGGGAGLGGTGGLGGFSGMPVGGAGGVSGGGGGGTGTGVVPFP